MNNEPLIGNNIRRARKAKEWSQAQLSRATGISTSALSAYENDKKRPGLDTLALIATSLGVSLDQLYFGESDSSFIASATNRGRLIVNCIYELWKQRVLSESSLYRDDADALHALGIHWSGNLPYEVDAYLRCPRIVRRNGQIVRLLESLADFEKNKSSYPRPELYLEQILESAANNINDEITREELPF